MTLLQWRLAEADDIPRLQHFECAKPKERRFGQAHAEWPRKWEAVVQGGIRALRPPGRLREIILVGCDDAGELGAVAWACDWKGPGDVKILSAGVSLALRQTFPYGRHADEMVDQMIAQIQGRALDAGLDTVWAWGLVHPKNAKSQALLNRCGFGRGEDDGDLQTWGIELSV